jgi:hypothetical protein
VTEARAKATQMTLPSDVLSNPNAFHEFEQRQAELGGALGRLLAVSEQYPDLKSNQNFLALHPDNPYIVYNDLPKLEKLRREFPTLSTTP